MIVRRGEQVIASRVDLAGSFALRLKGLLGKKRLLPGEGLWLRPCTRIHTWFMAFPLDVLYLDQAGKILDYSLGLPPGKIGPRVKGCAQVLEVGIGTIRKHSLKKGQQLRIEPS